MSTDPAAVYLNKLADVMDGLAEQAKPLSSSEDGNRRPGFGPLVDRISQISADVDMFLAAFDIDPDIVTTNRHRDGWDRVTLVWTTKRMRP